MLLLLGAAIREEGRDENMLCATGREDDAREDAKEAEEGVG